MNFNTDGFNERTNYIHNSNDLNKLKQNEISFDNSFAQMNVESHKNDVETVRNDQEFVKEEVRGNKENFVLRTNNMRNANVKPNPSNPVSIALNRNMFKK